MEIDLDNLPLTAMIRLQTQLSEVLARRFERQMALSFTDVVGSTAYFARYGDVAGRGLQQRHFDLLQSVLPRASGRIVDTAGDGAFCCYPSAESAVTALSELLEKITGDNASKQRPHHLILRAGVHFGPVLTDGDVVAGDSVNVAARVAAAAEPGAIRLTRNTFQELPNALRLRSKAMSLVELKGIPLPVELYDYRWRDTSHFPEVVRVEATGEVLKLPLFDVVSFGRLRESEGMPANDVVIAIPDEKLNRLVSRWHFELRRTPTGFLLKSVTDQVTEVDGVVAGKGADVPVRVGSVVCLGRSVVLTFLTPTSFGTETVGPGTI